MIRVRSAGWACWLALLTASGCARPVAPPASSPPSVDAALARMHASFACANAVQANGKLDHYGQGGRVRGEPGDVPAGRPPARARHRVERVSPVVFERAHERESHHPAIESPA